MSVRRAAQLNAFIAARAVNAANFQVQWIVDNTDAIEDLYLHFKNAGQSCFGRAFFQIGNVTSFANFLYRFTTPGADNSE